MSSSGGAQALAFFCYSCQVSCLLRSFAAVRTLRRHKYGHFCTTVEIGLKCLRCETPTCAFPSNRTTPQKHDAINMLHFSYRAVRRSGNTLLLLPLLIPLRLTAATATATATATAAAAATTTIDTYHYYYYDCYCYYYCYCYCYCYCYYYYYY